MSKSIIIFCLFCFSGLFAQSQANITGNVKSSENENLTLSIYNGDDYTQGYGIMQIDFIELKQQDKKNPAF